MAGYYNPWDDPAQNPYLGDQSYIANSGMQPPAAPVTVDRPPTTPTGASPSNNGNPAPAPGPTTTTPFSQSALESIFRKYPATLEGRQQAIAEANKTFGTSLSWTGSKMDKILMPDGRTLDWVIGAGTGNPTWGSGSDAGGVGGGGVPGGFGSVSLDPSYYAPWTGTAPTPGVPTFTPPPDFVAPTAQSVLQDPSYLFRLSQGEGALENSAAAKGTLNSGGTLQDIINYGQKAGSQEYGNVWDRQFGLWNASWNNSLTGYRANVDANNSAYQRAWNAYTDARDSFYKNEDNAFSRLYQVANLGASSAAAS